MIPAPFDYSSPTTLKEALALLKQHGDEAQILAGGHSLIHMMKLRFASPGHVIDINNIPGLSYVKEEGGFLKIGALTREVELEESDIIRQRYPIFTDASRLIADPQVRNRGTIGGNNAPGRAPHPPSAVNPGLRRRVRNSGTQCPPGVT